MSYYTETVYKCLEQHILIKITHLEHDIFKYKFILGGHTLNRLSLSSLVFNNSDVIDVCLNTTVNLNTLNITQLDYFFMPPEILLSDITDHKSNLINTLGSGFLLESKEYVKQLKEGIIAMQLDFKEYLKEHYIYDNFSLQNQDFIDVFVLTMFPIVKEPTPQEVENYYTKITDNYFIDSFQPKSRLVTDIQISTVDALQLLNIPDSNFCVTDTNYLNAARRQWVKIINKHKNIFLEELYSVDETQLDKEELKQFGEEIELLKKEIDETIAIELNQKNSIEDIISYWPELIQPLPSFVYAKD